MRNYSRDSSRPARTSSGRHHRPGQRIRPRRRSLSRPVTVRFTGRGLRGADGLQLAIMQFRGVCDRWGTGIRARMWSLPPSRELDLNALELGAWKHGGHDATVC